MTAKLYKVVTADGHSTHGGSLEWSLPTKTKPGKWHEVTGKLSMCNRGLHLTAEPIAWWVAGSRVFEAEYKGEIIEGPGKVCVRKARLIREVPWSEFQVWSEGRHSVTEGAAKAFDSATVEAFGSATVEAFGSATVRASDSATVEASDSATVRAFDSATVEAFGSATVEAFGSATVRAFGSATVRAFGSATVEAFDSATVIRMMWHSNGSVTLVDGSEAVCVDRRGKVVVSVAKAVK